MGFKIYEFYIIVVIIYFRYNKYTYPCLTYYNNQHHYRRDSVKLGKIAASINPDTKYKETGKYFKIKGWR